MIRKPSGVQQEAKLHAAVGSVIHTGAEVRAVARKMRLQGRMIGVTYIFVMMGFGLLFSSTPIWFKLVLFGGGYWLFKMWKSWIANQQLKG